MTEPDIQAALSPPQGNVKPYDDFLKLLETRSVPKVDKSFLQGYDIASGNEGKFIRGLRFLGLVDKEGKATQEMDGLSAVGEPRRENLARILRHAYSRLFDVAKIDLEKIDSDTLINSFKGDYKIGSPATAKQSAQILVFLAQKAGLPLSQSLVEKSVSQERAKTLGHVVRKPRAHKTEEEVESKTVGGVAQAQLPQEALARFTVKDIGYVDIKDKDTLQIAKAYLGLLSKKLGIPEAENQS